MRFVGVFEFSLQCFYGLAWPLLSLVYPLRCSIRAIEADSISDSQKLNAYWVIFSLVLLLEHTFMKLLEWFPLWPYVKLLTVACLVIPYFDGAFFVYEHLIHPCFSMDVHIVIKWFNKRKESSFMRDHFLPEVERYVKENGPEALEKLVASESKRRKSKANLKEVKAVPSRETKESLSGKLNVALEDIKAVQVISQVEPNLTETESSRPAKKDIKEKAIGVVSDRGLLKTPPSKNVQQWTCAINQVSTQSDTTFSSNDGKRQKAVFEVVEVKNQTECKLTQIQNSTTVAADTKEKALEGTTGGVLDTSPKVQKVFTCALCQLTVESEAVINSHLQGRKHKVKCEALKAKNLELPPNIVMASTAKNSDEPNLKNSDEPNLEPINSTESSAAKEKTILHEKLLSQNDSSPALLTKNSDKLTLEPAEGAFANGAKLNVTSLPLSCNICNVNCPSEIVMASHLQGKKHQKKMQQLQQNPN